MRLDEIYHGDSLKADDLQGKDCRVTIRGYEVIDFDDGKKIVLSFAKTERTLICNKTNANTISDMYGQELDNWIGKPVTLFPTQTDFQGRQVACIRVRIGQPQSPPQPPQQFTGKAERLDTQPPASEPPGHTEYVSGSQDEGESTIPF